MGQYEEIKQSEVAVADAELRRPPKWRSWRVTVLLGALTSSMVLLLNAGVLLWTLRNVDVINGIATVYQGDCNVTAKINTFGHLAINILGTLLLSASNNCAQLLSSPSRDDIAAAHKQGRWLDVGVSSFRNLKNIPRWRMSLWTLLMLSSLPLHLLYNSVLFNTLAFHDVVVTLVTEDFTRGGWWNETRSNFWQGRMEIVRQLQEEAMTGSLQELEKEECMRAYMPSDTSTFAHGNVLLVTSLITNESALYSQNLDYAQVVIPYTNISTLDELDAYETITTSPKAKLSECDVLPADWAGIYDKSSGQYGHWVQQGQEGVDDEFWVGVDVSWNCPPIVRCLAERHTPKCTARLETRFLAVVLACNLLKTVAMLVVAFGRLRPLATIGDAISSFLADTDGSALAHGPISAIDAARSDTENPTGRVFTRRTLRWWHAANTRPFGRLVVCLIMAVALCVIASILVGISVSTAKVYTDTDPGLMKFTLLASQANAHLVDGTDTLPLTTNAILPNIPQVIVSFIYLFYNNALTSMLMAYEYSDFGSNRQTLRVSQPVGEQRSTYWLQLPFRYAFPLMAMMGTLHWLISRSLFLVQIDYYLADGDLSYRTSACGSSWPPLTLALGLGVILIATIVGLSLRKLDSSIPLAGSCSLAISAACSAASEQGASTMPLQYGVLMSKPCDEQGRRYVGFSMEEVAPLEDGEEYL